MATAFWPPNPKPLIIAVSTRALRFDQRDVVEVAFGQVGVLEVGGRRDDAVADRAERRERGHAPAAPSRWPTIDFGELIGTCGARSPKAALIARVSVTSLSGVDVPWATM